MGWLPPKKQSSRKVRPARAAAGCLQDPAAMKVARRLAARVAAVKKAARRKAKAQLPGALKHALAASSTPAPHRVKPEDVWRGERREGRSTSYYAAEVVALAADNEAVVAAHNRALALQLLEQAEREVVRQVCRGFRPLFLLSEKERKGVLASLGLEESIVRDPLERTDFPPPRAVARCTVCIRLPVSEDENFDPEVLELFEDDQARWEANGEGKRGNGRRKAQLAAAEMVRAGVRATKIYASAKGQACAEHSASKGGRIVAWRIREDGTEEFEFEEEEQ